MSEKVFTVTCFGDSITEGIGACPMDRMSYPAQLQRLLGDGYRVLNMGASGLTLQREGDYPYYKDPRYEAAFASEPDAVLLMIGTNDSKNNNWDPDRYEAALRAEIERFQALPSRPLVLLSSCCAAFSDIDTISNEVIGGEMMRIQRKTAKAYKTRFVDVTTVTGSHPEWFCDGIHPSNEGYGKLAEIFRNELLAARTEAGV
ncbi:MAG: hypothetical protein J5843_02850 [Clostridia bacterium]|nr:hypothetical protein [Clostridia bacterium]